MEGTESDTETVDIAFETEYIDDPTLLEGKTKVVTTGVNGSKTVTTTYTHLKSKIAEVHSLCTIDLS
ncbi:TPA: G5 domain-containing protein [Streptococcus suis]